MRRFTHVLALGTMLVLLAVPVAFASGEMEETETVLRVASAIQGPEEVEIYDAVVAAFEAENPGVTVEWDRSTGDDYQFTGLPSLLESDTPPDIYFEWGGDRVASRAADGYAMDLSDLAEELRPQINSSAWSGTMVDGDVYMIPDNQDITIMLWYNQNQFDELGLSAPSTWEEFLTLSQALVDEGINPILMGNSGAWVAGNFGSLFIYREAGEDYTDRVLSLEEGTRLNNSRFVEALEHVYDLGERGYVNQDLNTLGYEPSFARLFDGSAAMYPLGTWFKDEVVAQFSQNPEGENWQFFNLPPIPGGRGASNSIMGLNTGWMINGNTEVPDLASEFMRVMMREEFQARLAESGRITTHTEALESTDSEYVQSVAAMLNDTPQMVAPPDTGYNLEMAGALYEAIAKVFVNAETPQQALDAAEQKIQHLR